MHVNKNHPAILGENNGKNESYISIRKAGLFFTSTAAKRYGLKAGKYLHFDNDGKSWMFWQSDDDTGFYLHPDKKHNSNAVYILNIALVKMFKNSLRLYKSRIRFSIFLTDAYVGENRMMEINTSKTYDELMKAI